MLAAVIGRKLLRGDSCFVEDVTMQNDFYLVTAKVFDSALFNDRS